MMFDQRFTKLILVFGLSLLFSCQKDVQEQITETEADRNTNITSNVAGRLSYGDTVFYLRNQAGNFTKLPVSKPAAPGKFRSFPKGLKLDSISGRINITQSETGLRYKVYYVGNNNYALDSVKIVISGIDYRDEIFEIARTPNRYDTAFPIYNARPELLLPCGDDDEDDDGDLDDDDNQCVFDETDLNNDGNDDIPGVIQSKLLVDTKKGTIDVEASFYAGLFGSSNPPNGAIKNLTFYYRLQDASNKALNKITVRVYHYRRRSDIPQSLLNTLNVRNQMSGAVNSRFFSAAVEQSNEPEIDDQYGSSFTERVAHLDLFQTRPKRPPIIIIVSQ
jgi:hypothetical protein